MMPTDAKGVSDMDRIISVFLCFALLAASAVAKNDPTDATVLGLRLGETFTVPECARSKPILPSRLPDSYAGSDSIVCFKRDPYGLLINYVPANTPIVNDQSIRIYFPKSVSELSSNVLAQVIDGKLEGLELSTFGVNTQDEVLATLVEKFGEPKSVSEQQLQNSMGAVFTSHLVSWDVGILHVLFSGAGSRIDAGFVIVRTERQAAFLREIKERQKAASAKL